MDSQKIANYQFLEHQKKSNPSNFSYSASEVRSVPGDTESQTVLTNSKNFFVYPNQFLSKKGRNYYHKLINNFSFDGSVEQYLGLTKNDPHYIFSLLKLHDIHRRIGSNPDNQSTQLNFHIPTIISFGVGDGNFLKTIVDSQKPYNLFICLRQWSDLELSFSNINWLELWNSRCLDDTSSTYFIIYEDINHLLATIVNTNLLCLEHALVTVPGPSNSYYKSDRIEFLNPLKIAQTINYLGFTIDEYNMMNNTIDTLTISPNIKLFHKPNFKTHAKFVVVGSGPSLDDNIETIKTLASDHIIIACASNYRVLRKNDINVDYLCLLERGSYEYDNYLSVKNEFGLGSTRLVASTTCDSRLHLLFDDSMVYFRGGVTPVSVFLNRRQQILEHEGPQTVNTGVALATALGANKIVLVGVDLGAASLKSIRSASAVGSSQRDMSITYPGNHQEVVYTCELLLDGCIAMENITAKPDSPEVYNLSNGIKIKNTIPMKPSDYYALNQNDQQLKTKYNLDDWWLSMPVLRSDELLLMWKSARPGILVFETMNQLRNLFQSQKPWFPVVQREMSEILSLSNVPFRQQIAKRMIRAIFLKLATTIARQYYVLYNQDPSGKLSECYIDQSRLFLHELTLIIESELYQLFSIFENKLSLRNHS